MRATLHGRLTGPAAAVIGVWDPLLHEHHDLFRALREHARANGHCSLAILLNPDPGMFLSGATRWPVYDDVRTRIRLILRDGVDAVLHTRFAGVDVEAGADQFLTYVSQQADIRHLWLGARQTLGNGAHGDEAAIARVAAGLGIEVTRLSPARVRAAARIARQCLLDGDLAGAIAAVGRPPLRSRPPSGRLRLAWHPGLYEAVPLPDPSATPSGVPIPVWLRPECHGLPIVTWPESAPAYLAFVARVERQADRAA